MNIKVAIADDHPIVLQGLENILRDHPTLELSGIFRDGDALLNSLKLAQPDVLLLDVQMPGKQGDELAKIITAQYPGLGIIALTNMDQAFTVRSMFSAGAKGYLLKSADKNKLVEAIETVNSGKSYLDTALRGNMLDDVMKGEQEKPFLTYREQEIMELIAQEMTTKDIAKKLFLSMKTVENSRINLFLKLEVKNVAGLVRKGIQMGLIK